MAIQWIDDEDFEVDGKVVLCRVDFNVPMQDGVITDDERIRRALPTLELLLEKGARLLVCSHLGRPKGKYKKEFSLEPVAVRLQELLEKELIFSDDCVGDGRRHLIRSLEAGQVILLENTRFHGGEEKNDKGFGEQLAEDVDVYVNDAFGTAHRAHASTEGITRHVEQSAGGLLIRSELEHLGGLLRDPKRPFVAILGGAKVSDKLQVLSQLMNKVDKMIIGGAMAYTFLKAQELPVGKSRVEDDRLKIAASILEQAEKKGVEFLLPVDHVVAEDFAEDADARTLSTENFSDDVMGLDIGPKTLSSYRHALAQAKTIFWNGPMGVFEWDAFAEGTLGVMDAVCSSKAFTVVGGGDSVAAVNKSGRAGDIDHVSTGGGASLELLEGKKLPGLVALGMKS
ncbi:MAG: phosphoglycerate kinase [Deltaproteobacteria bacterium]|nr:phosphoglycerate kinase [Deltaproteobacteria bacterium]